MTSPITTLEPSNISDADRTFPTLTEAQVARVARNGNRRRVELGQILAEGGRPVTHFYVVVSGDVEGVQLRENGGVRVRTIHAGQFTGEASILSGRPALVTLRVCDAGEVIEVDR